MNNDDFLKEAKARLTKAKKAIDERHDASKDIEEPDLIVSGAFTELDKKRREKYGDFYDEED